MNCLPQSLHLYIWLEPLRPFLTTFEEQQKKHFFYHIINNMAQIYEYQDIDAHVILLFVHPAENGECDSPDTKKSAALPCDKAADFVHSQGFEPWTH